MQHQNPDFRSQVPLDMQIPHQISWILAFSLHGQGCKSGTELGVSQSMIWCVREMEDIPKYIFLGMAA
ncbi:hypothetical protein SLA2020_306020 [Shorea laevis]